MADVIRFTIQGDDKFSGTMGKVNQSLTSMFSVVTKVTGAVAAAGAGLFLLTDKFTQAEDRVGKFADRLGESVEAISAIEFAAERSGIAVSAVDSSMQRLTRRAEEAAQGMGEAAGAFDEMGINADDFVKLPMEDKLSAIADGLVGMEDQTRLAFKLFDTEGVAMLQMLNDGSDGFQQLMNDAERFGAVMSGQAVANAERFQDAMTNAKAASDGIFRGISDELTPIFTTMLDSFGNFLVNSRQGIITFVKNTIRGFFTIAAVVEQVFNKIGEFINNFFTKEGFEENLKSMRDAFVNSFQYIIDYLLDVWPKIGRFLLDIMRVAFDGMVAIGRWAWENIKSIWSDDSGPSLADLIFAGIPEATEKAREQLEESSAILGETMTTFYEEMGINIAETFGITSDFLESRVEEMMEKYSTFGKQVESTNSAIDKSSKSFIKSLNKEWLKFMKKRGDEFTYFVTQMGKLIELTVASISKAIAQSIVSGKNLLKEFENIAKSVLETLIAVLIEIGVQRIVTKLISLASNKAESASEASSGVAGVFVNQFKSQSGAPWPLNLTAPAVAAGMAAAAIAGYGSYAAAGAGVGASAVADGGLTNVPTEATYQLTRGERVLSPNQNEDLTNFLNDTGGLSGSTVNIENLTIEVLANATNADSFLAMPPEEMREIVSSQLIPAMDALARLGIKPTQG